MKRSRRKQGLSEEVVVLTKATIRAAQRLGLSQKALALIIGLSEPTISRMQRGKFKIDRGSGKAFELAQLLVRLYDALDRLVAGDEAAMRAWMGSDNSALGGRPVDLILTVRGLSEVVGYLQARSLL